MGALTFNLLERAEVEELHKKVKPVVRVNGELWTIVANYDLINAAYLWDMLPSQRVANYQLVKTQHTVHKWGYYGYFRPSVVEVLSCIKPTLDVCAIKYYELTGPQSADDLNAQLFFLDNGLHLAEVKLYV